MGAIPLLGMQPTEIKPLAQGGARSPMFTAALFTAADQGNQLHIHCERMDKEDVALVYNGILLSLKKGNPAINLEEIILSEIIYQGLHTKTETKNKSFLLLVDEFKTIMKVSPISVLHVYISISY